MDAHMEDDDEQAAGVAFALQQPCTVAVSSFFVEPNPPGYACYETAA